MEPPCSRATTPACGVCGPPAARPHLDQTLHRRGVVSSSCCSIGIEARGCHGRVTSYGIAGVHRRHDCPVVSAAPEASPGPAKASAPRDSAGLRRSPRHPPPARPRLPRDGRTLSCTAPRCSASCGTRDRSPHRQVPRSLAALPAPAACSGRPSPASDGSAAAPPGQSRARPSARPANGSARDCPSTRSRRRAAAAASPAPDAKAPVLPAPTGRGTAGGALVRLHAWITAPVPDPYSAHPGQPPDLAGARARGTAAFVELLFRVCRLLETWSLPA